MRKRDFSEIFLLVITIIVLIGYLFMAYHTLTTYD